MTPKVDSYLSRCKKWREETEKLRIILLDCHLIEELKWGKPSYAFDKRNIVLIQGFKDYIALLFFKGALLKDADGILNRLGENTQAGRQIRFTNVQQIIEKGLIVKAHILEAIEVEKAGLKVTLKENSELILPEEFQSKLDEDAALKGAFDALTPGRQKGYYLFFSQPKLAKNRESRVEKSIHQILRGKGLND